MSPATPLRTRLEEREDQLLAPHAAHAARTQGRAVPEAEHPYRTAFQRDRDRILHSKSFRRLKGKTQVFLAAEGDHYRTRLTHTLEVAQIARTAARALMLNEDLVEAISLGHDLGHTPFGHAGEWALNQLLPGGFNHAEQSLRVVDLLEERHDTQGLNLTFEVRDGIANHSKGKAVLEGLHLPAASTLEGNLVSLCDAVAYINHDIDDAIRGGLLAMDDLPPDALEVVGRSTSRRINTMVDALIEGSRDGAIDMTPEVRGATRELRTFLYRNLYPCPPIENEIDKARKLVERLFEHMVSHFDPDWTIGEARHSDSTERTVADLIAGMTDRYAMQLYQRLFFPRSWDG
jgi:dGTPase